MHKWVFNVAAVGVLVGGVSPIAPAAGRDQPAGEHLPTAETSLARILATWEISQTPAPPRDDQPCAQPGAVLSLPAIGPETSRFGARSDPLGAGWRVHAGIDLAAPQGSPVVAAGKGAVLRVGWARGYGNLVTIDHGQGLTTRYAHLQRSIVRAGQDVASGQEIGLVGATGHATGNHLHFEIRQSGRAIDPDHLSQACSDQVAMAPVLGEVAAQSRWTQPASDGALPTIVLR